MSTPKFARWLLGVTLSADQRDDVLANLEELYRLRRQTHGVFAANLWYWKQALSFSVYLRWSTRRSSVERPRRSFRRSELFVQFVEDLSYAVRSFRRSPGFLFAAVATLALGFGANTVIFAVVNASVLRPLPFPNAEQLVWVWPSGEIPLTYLQFRDLRAEAKPVADLSAVAFRSYAVFFTVAGVVGDVRQSALRLPPRPEIYLPLDQSEWASAMTMVVRTVGSVPGLASQLRRIVRTVDLNVPITRLASMEAIVSDSLAGQRFYSVLFSLCASKRRARSQHLGIDGGRVRETAELTARLTAEAAEFTEPPNPQY